MAIKSDRWIKNMSMNHGMIDPFEDNIVRDGKISYGLSSYGYDIRVAYGDSKNYPREMLDKVEEYGGTLVPLRPNMMKILYNTMSSLAREKGWQKLPYAFDDPIYHNYWYDKVKKFIETNDSSSDKIDFKL